MAYILVVDDDALLRKAIVMTIRSAGHGVAAASNGDEGLKMLRTDGADLVVTDLEMPYGGLKAVSVLRAEFPRLPIIVISGREESLPMAITLGATLTLTKPFTLEQLLDAVAGVTASSTARL